MQNILWELNHLNLRKVVFICVPISADYMRATQNNELVPNL